MNGLCTISCQLILGKIKKQLFFSRMKSPPKLSIHGDYSLKQHSTVEYLGCCLNSNLNGESMASRVLKKNNTKLNFLLR